MGNRGLLITLILCFLSFSCASVGVNSLMYYPAKSRNCHLDLYTHTGDIQIEYEEICILYSETGSTLFSTKTYEQAIELAKPKACRCGADAIVVASVEKIGVSLFTWGEGRAKLIGIRYK